jgi:hypothetical protein
MDYNRDFTSVAKQIDFATLKPSQAAEAAESLAVIFTLW